MNLIGDFFFILTQKTAVKNNPLYAKAYICILYKNTKSYANFRCLRLPIFRRRCCSHSLTLKPSSYASAAEENAAIMCRRRPCKRKREVCFIYLVQGFPDVRYYFPSSNAFRRSRRLNAAMNAMNQTSEKFLKNSPPLFDININN